MWQNRKTTAFRQKEYLCENSRKKGRSRKLADSRERQFAKNGVCSKGERGDETETTCRRKANSPFTP